jgi:hypothetical protein
MARVVEVPLRLLEDIFRMLEYLNRRRHRDSDLWGLWIKIDQLQSQIMDSYLMTIGDVTDDEMRDLQHWVDDGHCIYENPHLISDESGSPMDFINACRIVSEMAEDPELFFGRKTDTADDGDCGDWDDMPF